jgi:ribonuclease P protein subunit RPR2
MASKKQKRLVRRTEKREQRSFGQEAVSYLLDESLRLRMLDPKRAQDLAENALKIRTRVKIRLPRQYRLKFCRTCHTPLSVETARVRLNSKKRQVHYQCLKCGQERRFGYVMLKKSKRAKSKRGAHQKKSMEI